MQKGLSSAKAAELLEKHGENLLSADGKQSAAAIFAAQFKDLLTLILLCSTVISLLLGEYADAITIMAIVFINAVLGFSQEYRTERTLESLRTLAAPKAAVYRDGVKTEIPASRLVPGDVVILSAGCKVPADGRVLSAAELFANEALLTGESAPVQKLPDKNTSDKDINPGFVYMGTAITAGHGEFIVTATGMNTQMGKIAGLLKETKTEATPLQKRLSVLSKYIAAGCIIICVIVTLTGILRGEPVFDMFLTGISLSVAAIPEGLTAVITISLGLAVSRMLKKNALIRRLHSVETLGCADVICSDKTGTLTENKMTVTEVFLPEGKKIPLGGAYPSALSEPLLLCATLCNNSEKNGHGGVSGEPTEAALLEMVLTHGSGTEKKAATFTRTAEIPFDSARKLMSVGVKDKAGRGFVFVKGAPDVLLPLCTDYLYGNEHRRLSPEVLSGCKAALSEMAAGALRVLALGYKDYSGGKIIESGFTLLGFCGMLDPPRRGAAESVLKCKRAGIRTVMITGDHPETALAIAKKLRIARSASDVRTGAQLDLLSPAEFEHACEHCSVFARVTPAHKLRIVRALKKRGHIVAMTGDGVNDAPAVKEADIGVAMGKNGTDVTREAGGIVLLDDDFSTLVSAVEEGRIIYQNIRKFIRYLLSCNIGEVVTMFFGMLMGMPVILLPIQILMVNLVTDGIPAIALSFDPPQDDVMEMRPRGREESVFSGGLASTIIIRGLLLGISVLAAFTVVLGSAQSVEHARTAAFVTLVFTQLVHVFECKSESRSLFTINIFNNPKLIFAAISSAAIVLSTVYIPYLQPIFKTVSLSGSEMLAVLCSTLSVPLVSSVIMLLRHGK